jgi:hypothetical protein
MFVKRLLFLLFDLVLLALGGLVLAVSVWRLTSGIYDSESWLWKPFVAFPIGAAVFSGGVALGWMAFADASGKS